MQKIIFSFCFLVALAFSATAFPFFPDRRVVPKTSASYLASHRNVLKSLFDSCKTTQKEIIFNDNNAPFYSCYSESLNGPEWTAHVRRPYFEPAGPKTNDNWKVPEKLSGMRSGSSFRPSYGISWSRGHLVPRADLEPEFDEQTFSVINCVPQPPKMNSIVWEHVERAVRRYGDDVRKHLLIVTVPVYDSSTVGRQVSEVELEGAKAVTIPSQLIKVVYTFGSDNKLECAACINLINNRDFDHDSGTLPQVRSWSMCKSTLKKLREGAFPAPSNSKDQECQRRLAMYMTKEAILNNANEALRPKLREKDVK